MQDLFTIWFKSIYLSVGLKIYISIYLFEYLYIYLSRHLEMNLLYLSLVLVVGQAYAAVDGGKWKMVR